MRMLTDKAIGIALRGPDATRGYIKSAWSQRAAFVGVLVIAADMQTKRRIDAALVVGPQQLGGL